MHGVAERCVASDVLADEGGKFLSPQWLAACTLVHNAMLPAVQASLAGLVTRYATPCG